MEDRTEEWKRICEQAAREQDPERLLMLSRRIAELLDQRVLDARAGRMNAKAKSQSTVEESPKVSQGRFRERD